MDPLWQSLLEASRSLHGGVAELQAFCAFPDPVTERPVAPKLDPLCAAMRADPGLHAPPALAPFRDAILAAGPAAHWRDTYRDTAFGARLHANFGCYEVLGRDTPLGAPDMRGFAVYQTAGFHYPLHHHPAEELYLVVAGQAEFHLEGAPPRILGPGETAFHPSNAPHALTTHDHPVLAYVLWRGDLLSRPVWTDPGSLG